MTEFNRIEDVLLDTKIAAEKLPNSETLVDTIDAAHDILIDSDKAAVSKMVRVIESITGLNVIIGDEYEHWNN